MTTDTITLPAAWACALINGDYTGFDFSCQDGGEALRCSTAEDELAAEGWSVVDCGEAYFTWSYNLYDRGADCSGGEVADYTIVKG
jgi:hypothetical protein